jgi:acyl dehydratase
MSVPEVRWDEIAEGSSIPPLVDEITYRRVIMNPGATGDYFPGHYDPDYARRQGQPTIYANSLHVFGIIDRAVSEWTGPRGFLIRRNVRLVSSMYAGDTVTVTGVVSGKRVDGDQRVVDVDLTMTNHRDQVICTARTTVRLSGPARAQ